MNRHSSITVTGTTAVVKATPVGGEDLTFALAAYTAAGTALGTGQCPSSASTCGTFKAASGRTLVIGSNSYGLVTSVADPLGRTWTYAYNSSDQLTSATRPMSNVTSYTYGQANTGSGALAGHGSSPRYPLVTGERCPRGRTAGPAAEGGKKLGAEWCPWRLGTAYGRQRPLASPQVKGHVAITATC
jgi:YD repeat-containing protein